MHDLDMILIYVFFPKYEQNTEKSLKMVGFFGCFENVTTFKMFLIYSPFVIDHNFVSPMAILIIIILVYHV